MRNLIPFQTKDARGTGGSLLPVTRLHWDLGDFDQVLGRFFGDAWGVGHDSVRLDIDETPDEIVVRAEIPGVDPKDVEIELQGEVLTIAGEKKHAATQTPTGTSYSERSFGAFRRQVGLPYPIEVDKVRAEHANGVLSIHLPKAEAARPHRIEVKAS